MSTEIKKSPAVPPFARNMIIGVITTVLVSATVYLLGFNKKSSGPSKLERQKATTDAWKTYVVVENIYAKNTILLYTNFGQYSSVNEVFGEFKKESDKFITSLRGLITNEDVDKDMISLLKRRVQNEEATLPTVEKFYDELNKLVDVAVDEDWTEKRLMDTVTLRFAKFGESNKGTIDRSITEIEDLSKTLSERYRQPFDIDEFFVIQVYKYKKDPLSLLNENKKQVAVTKEYLTGKWDVSGATIILYADDKWSWSVPADSSMAEGSWELKNGQLVMNLPKHPKTGEKGVWTFDLSDVSENSFSMQLLVQGGAFYTLIRKR
jgi:hypothetical protein